jgi:hypothetical protein
VTGFPIISEAILIDAKINTHAVNTNIPNNNIMLAFLVRLIGIPGQLDRQYIRHAARYIASL